MAQSVPENINFAYEEEKILKLWKELDAFKTSLKQSKNRPRYIFYDGPPFATGLPHYGHILAGTVKDIITRWAHQSGFHVERRFGWDCHGLPVEYEIDKKLGITGPADVAKMGIANYNAECRKIVMRYSKEWVETVTRLGRWIDFDNDYKTMYPWFMESIWWVFKTLYDSGLVYKGFKVMPFSTACNTPLSNFESGQNYKEVSDPAVVINFPLVEDPSVLVVAWTTTPWTLPSNLALCVHPDLTYVEIKEKKSGKNYILMEARISSLFKVAEDYTIVKKFKGSSLEGKEYKPIFNYFEKMKERGAFKILTDTYVTDSSGTGVVHQAPYFGEDDYRVCLRYGIITRDMKPVCPVDLSGKFTDEVTDFKGQYVKDADKNIMKHLKQSGRLVSQATALHDYPFCWRSDTPLIYRAIPSWFIRVEQMQQRLIESNEQTYWVPDFVKEKRFGNWLRSARDWAVSRNRYWGNPIPIWTSEDGEEVVCVGSIDELKKLSGRSDITDIHKESIDDITIPSVTGRGVLKRVPEVFDCWFESGSMPYAQAHFPFENQREFEDNFPGDFIAEGIDQTRGWFYTLMVLSTALFGKPPFKNLICHGLVLAADGQKMSKRKKNYPDPVEITNKYGADAIRLYLINSPVVRAENLRFKEEGVRDVIKDVFLPWFNAFRFLTQNLESFKKNGESLLINEDNVSKPVNYMDRWITSFTQSLIKFVQVEMKAYRLYTVVPRLVKFVEQLTNWYVRMNRRRLKGEGGPQDCRSALTTLFTVLYSMTKVMAPFIPFLTEFMYQHLKHYIDPASVNSQDVRSVHFLMLPKPNDSLIDTDIEEAMSRMQVVIDLARVVRERNTLPLKYPLKEIVVIHKDQECLDHVSSLEKYIKEELNVKQLVVTRDKVKYGVRLSAEPNHRVLGSRLKTSFKSVSEEIRKMSDAQLTDLQKNGQMEVFGHKIALDDVHLRYVSKGIKEYDSYEAHSDNDILILLDITPDQQMLDEGLAREVINRVQRLRKKGKLSPADPITVYYHANKELDRVIRQFSEFINQTVQAPFKAEVVTKEKDVIVTEKSKFKEHELDITLVRGADSVETSGAAPPAVSSSHSPAPYCRFINVHMLDGSAGDVARQGTVLLENPKGEFIISYNELVQQVKNIFGVHGSKITLFKDKQKTVQVLSSTDILSLDSHTLYASL